MLGLLHTLGCNQGVPREMVVLYMVSGAPHALCLSSPAAWGGDCVCTVWLASLYVIIKYGNWGPSCASLLSFVFDVVSSVLYPATEDFRAAQSAGTGAFKAGGLVSFQVSKGRLCQQNLAKMLVVFARKALSYLCLVWAKGGTKWQTDWAHAAGFQWQHFANHDLHLLHFLAMLTEELVVEAGLITLLCCYQILFNDRVLCGPLNFTQNCMHALVLKSKMLHIAPRCALVG